MIRFQALALDYDRTLASHDRLADATVAALERARQAGLQLVLVTGRTFFELTRVCHRLDLFDVVVAENGAVLHDPANGAIRDEGPGPPPRLIAALDRAGIPCQIGRVIVATGRAYEAPVRRVMAEAGVELDLARNRAALMLLPRGVSKGSGVRQALQRLGLSFHDVLSIGDAENDLAHHAPRGDLSRWIADVFLDRRLASQVRKAERRVDTDGTPGLRAALTGLLARLIES